MNSFFKGFKKLSRKQSTEVAAFCGAVAILLLFAGVVSSGGMQKINHLLVVNHILPDTQTGCVFPCNNNSYTLEALIPMQGGVPVSTVLPGSVVNWQWNAGSYGANNFLAVCNGLSYGQAWMCTVQINAPNTNFGSCMPDSYGAPYCPPGHLQMGCGKYGCNYFCDVPEVSDFIPGSGCGNADDRYGHACFGRSGGWVASGSQPGCSPDGSAASGYDGNYPASTLSLNAPVTPGTYTYYFCSNWLLHAPNGTALSCLGSNLIVSTPAPTCTVSPANVYYGQSTNQTYTTTNASSVTYTLDGVAQGAPAGNPFNANGAGTLAVGSHTVVMTVTGPGGVATCGSANNVVISTPPAPSCTLTPASQTIPNGSSASFTYTVNNQGWATPTYKVDGGGAVTPPSTTFSVSGLGVGSHNVIMTAVNSVGATATCGVNGNVTVSAVPLPTVSVTAGGASSVTVPVGGTTTLKWTASGANPGAISLTAPMSGSTVSNLGTASWVSSVGGSNYFGSYLVSGGYIYLFGGYDGAVWTNKLWRAPVGSTIGSGAWTLMGTFANTVSASISDPMIIGNNAYIFGGYNSTAGVYNGTICTAPVSTMSNPANWTCPATLPAAMGWSTQHPVIIGDYVYRFGGYNGNSTAGVGRAPLSSPTTWTAFPNVLPGPVHGSGIAIVGNYVYVFGGFNSTPNAPVSTLYRALITSDLTLAASWSSGGTLPAAIDVPAMAVDSTYVYMIGGLVAGPLPSATIYRIPIATLNAGGVAAGSWSNIGSLPLAIYPAIPFINENKLMVGGGYNGGTGYTNPVYSVPFNDGLPYTSPANLPWYTDGGNNEAVTWPMNVNTVTYTLTGTNVSGSSNATAVVNEPDLCTNAPFTGIQNPLPSNTTAVGTTCTCTTGIWNGSACFVSPPIGTPTISPLITGSISAVKRVKRGNAVTLNWSVTGLVIGDTNSTCSVSSFPATAMTPITWNRTTTTFTQPVSAPTVTISGPTRFTVSCTNPTWGTPTVSASAQVNIVPTFQEQ